MAIFTCLLLTAPSVAFAATPVVSPALPSASPPAPWVEEPDAKILFDVSTGETRYVKGGVGSHALLTIDAVPVTGAVYVLDPRGVVAATSMTAVMQDDDGNVVSRTAVFHPVDLRENGLWSVIDANYNVLAKFTVLQNTGGQHLCEGWVDPTDVDAVATCVSQAALGDADGQHCATNHYHYSKYFDVTDNPAVNYGGQTWSTIKKYNDQQGIHIEGSCGLGPYFDDHNTWFGSWDIQGFTTVVGTGVQGFGIGFGNKADYRQSVYGCCSYTRYYTTLYTQTVVDDYDGVFVHYRTEDSKDGASPSSPSTAVRDAILALASWLSSLSRYAIPDFSNLIQDPALYTHDYIYNALTGHNGYRVAFNYEDHKKGDGSGYSYGVNYGLTWGTVGTHTMSATGSFMQRVKISTSAGYNTIEPGWINGYATITITRTS